MIDAHPRKFIRIGVGETNFSDTLDVTRGREPKGSDTIVECQVAKNDLGSVGY